MPEKSWSVLFFIPLFLFLNFTASHAGGSPDYSSLKKKAETFFEEGSYSRAHTLYQEAQNANLSASGKKWVAFRLADTLWRMESATHNPDNTKTEQARTQLERMVRDIVRNEDKDRIYAEVKESLADFWWVRNQTHNWSAAWQHYQTALDWWAGARDIEQARQRYLKIIWTIASPPWRGRHYLYGNYGNRLPMNILENVLKIAKQPEDRYRAQYLIALTQRRQGGWNASKRTSEAFEEALKMGKTSDWYDNALFHYAEWLKGHGEFIILKDGQKIQKQNFVKALRYYRRIVGEFSKGETRHYENAKRNISQITNATLNVNVSNIFLPGSEVQFNLNWRNLKQIDLSLHSIDLTGPWKPTEDINNSKFFDTIPLDRAQKIQAWEEETNDKGEHRLGNKPIKISKKLKTGAYLLSVHAGGLHAHQLILVTNAALVVKSSNQKTLLYFADSYDGSPIANAKVRLSERYRENNKWIWRTRAGKTNAEGLAVFMRDGKPNSGIYATARLKDRQAFAIGHHYYSSNKNEQWKLYVTTDRPAYRPKETAHWKLTARIHNGSVYKTPAGSQVEYEITDPRGAKLEKGETRLNSFGSAWGNLELSESIPLGSYRITFWSKGRKKHLGSAIMFRLEEYKLPEFKVNIQTPEENGRQKVFLSGQIVEVEIGADYFFGGPVINAEAEVTVYQKTFQPYWRPTPEFPWYFKDMDSPPHSWGNGQQIKREVIKTDALGKAHLKFKTPTNGQNLEYRIEVRVTDQSRREVRSSGTVRVSPKKFFAHLTPKHHLFQPNDRVTVDLKTLDANNQPLSVGGTIKITRDQWNEIWLDPSGHEVAGDQLKKLRAKSSLWPPPPVPGNKGWVLKFRGYEHEEILTRSIETSAEGTAEISFTPTRDGYYKFAFNHEDQETPPISANTTVWVATNETTELGFRTGGLQLIVDKDTFHAGETAPVMITASTGNRYVLFSVENEEIESFRLIHMEGPVKLVTLDIGEAHVPNIFLQADMISDHKIFRDTRQVVVPPVKQFLKVDVTTDKEQYGPRDKGRITVTTKDHEGKPVSAEVSLGLVDESVYAIQKDLAPDPRQFFWGDKRGHRVQTTSSFQIKRYIGLEEDEKGVLYEKRDLDSLRASQVSGGGRGNFAQYKAKSGKVAGFKNEGKSSAYPASAPMARDALSFADSSSSREIFAEEAMVGGNAGGGSEDPTVVVRSDFRTTIFWQPDVRTGRDGKAEINITFPDSLTEWRATARATTERNRVGWAKSQAHTQKPLIARLQAPRFFVVGDEVTLSAVINNNTDEPMTVTPKLDVSGLKLIGRKIGKRVSMEEIKKQVTVPARGEFRVDWLVRAVQAGDVRIKITTKGKRHGDAMEKTFLAHEHGIEKFIARSGKMRGDSITASFDLPKARKPDTTRVTVQVTPSLAVTMLDSLPYLIDFPYGCTEQTLSRFLPTVVVANTLKGLGLKTSDILGRVFGGIDHDNTGKTHRKGKRDLKKLTRMVEKGLDRLTDFQHSDGGWSWWKKGKSDPFMSAYVLWGLSLATQSGEAVNPNILARAYNYLSKVLVEAENDYALQAWELHAAVYYQTQSNKGRAGRFEKKAFENLWDNRTRLNAYTRALLALSAHYMKDEKRAQVLVRNLENGVIADDSPDTSIIQRGKQKTSGTVTGTAHWGEDGIYYRWSEGGVEATAFVLKALLTIAPKHKLVEPTVNWLIKNRRGAHWSNTRDTAIVLMTLTDYLNISGELETTAGYEVSFNGKIIAKEKVTDVLTAPSTFTVNASLIQDGDNRLQVARTSGKGPLYYSVQAEYFSLEEPIPAAGNEIFVRRQYYKLSGRPTLLKGYVYDKVPLKDGESLTSGDRVETVLTIEAKNHYEYLIFEDLKPAGFEAVEVKSGLPVYARELKQSGVKHRFSKDRKAALERTKQSVSARGLTGKSRVSGSFIAPPAPQAEGDAADYTGRQRLVYQELRDRKVALFVDKMPQGVWEIRYDLRAETPGTFHALPLMGHAMYIPEIRANGAEVRVTILDK